MSELLNIPEINIFLKDSSGRTPLKAALDYKSDDGDLKRQVIEEQAIIVSLLVLKDMPIDEKVSEVALNRNSWFNILNPSSELYQGVPEDLNLEYIDLRLKVAEIILNSPAISANEKGETVKYEEYAETLAYVEYKGRILFHQLDEKVQWFLRSKMYFCGRYEFEQGTLILS